MTLQHVTLEDKYTATNGRVYITGIQALVRLPMMQRQLDQANGLNTAGFISGYRGSPLGGYDQQLWKAKKHLAGHNIIFEPGINEDLAATAVWGSQQANLHPNPKFDGVFGLWYGKAPGVDRTGDVFRHANAAGTMQHGGVLAIAGDDHACKSSTLPSQSEYTFMDLEIPVLNPSGIQEILDYGLYGYAMSRFAGVWVSMIALAETMDASATVEVRPARMGLKPVTNFVMPPGGLSIRLGDKPNDQEKRLRDFRIPAVLAFARANQLNRVTIDSPQPKIGIVATGKSYLDLRQALIELGIDYKAAAALGLRVLKVGMTWPLEPDGIKRFAEGLETVMVIEEKRPMLETQIRDILYDMHDSRRPRVIGKKDQAGLPLLRDILDLNPALIAMALARVLPRELWPEKMRSEIPALEERLRKSGELTAIHERQPYYCSGCPHNTSTKPTEGSVTLAGIGCHYLVTMMPARETSLFTQMGGEGVPWIGTAPFTNTTHAFANLGDGTYVHSGLLAIRQAIASKANITYKILYNDAVAMTGGQVAEGGPTVADVAAQVHALGVAKLIVMADDPTRHAVGDFPPGTRLEHRDRLDAVSKELQETLGVTILLYDQTCAAEKRRRRKRGLMEDPPKRVFINEAVCEGCGDCSVKSNCVSVEPLETELGRKRTINQSSCNKDYSCVNGFCPSFVTLDGAKPLVKKVDADVKSFGIPMPKLPELGDQSWNIVICGIGGTGVTSIGAILGAAAHIEGKRSATLDMMGLAQKGGSVTSFVKIAADKTQIFAPRVATGSADLVLACDIVVATKPEAMDAARDGRTFVAANSDVVPTAQFVTDNAVQYDKGAMLKRLERAGRGMKSVRADALAFKLLGDSIYANMFLTGFAFQQGQIPLSAEAIEQAIELNGASVKQNIKAFNFGRLAAHDPEAVEKLAGLSEPAKLPQSFEELVARRTEMLTAYQNAAYAADYNAFVHAVRDAERKKSGGQNGFADAAAKGLYKLMAYKDEYEVARLYTDGSFKARLAKEFDGDYKINFHMSPPLIAPKDPDTGLPKKIALGGWMYPLFGVMARFKGLRGGMFDIFGYTAERRLERQMIKDYRAVLDELAAGLTPANHALAVKIAGLAIEIKGYGHIKHRNYEKTKAEEAKLLAQFRSGASSTAHKAAAE
jgi:indolepyruvate ferredoxin oxidoreductase